MDQPDRIIELTQHIAALEAALARYAHRYGLTDEARELLKTPLGRIVDDTADGPYADFAVEARQR